MTLEGWRLTEAFCVYPLRSPSTQMKSLCSDNQ